jgi:hypothetical protein
MKNTKFLVKLNRAGTRGPQYVQRVGKSSVETTSDRKLALVMGKFTAEDAIKTIQNARCTPELVPIQVPA